MHLRGARRVRYRPRLDRHRGLPRDRSVLAGGSGDDPRRAHRRAAALRHRQGRDPGRDRRASASPAASNTVLEFVGDGAAALSIDERLAVANMAVEAGSETGFFPADETIAAYLDGRTDAALDGRGDRPRRGDRRSVADRPRARCRRSIALPHSPGNVVPARRRRRARRSTRSTSATAPTGRSPTCARRRSILRGRQVHARTRLIIVPASQQVYRQALAEGLIDDFVEAGAMVSTPTCGACFGGSGGILAAGESALATTNRNFRGRMGSGESRSTSPTPGWRRPPPSPARSSTRPRCASPRRCPHDRHGHAPSSSAGRRRHGRALPGPVPQHRPTSSR